MKKTILSTFFLLTLFLQILNAQQAITTGNITSIACKGGTILVPFSLTGTFDNGNVFKVQIRSSNDNIWTDLVTEGTTSPLKATIPLNINSNYYSYYLRVVANKPNILGTDSYLPSISTKADLTLSDATITTINPYNATNLIFKGSGSVPIKVVFNDSSRITLNYINTDNNFYDLTNKIYPSKSTVYKIAYIENVCGRSSGSGSATITVNDIGIKTLKASSNYYCVGNVLRISYSADGKLDSGNKFKINLRSTDNTFQEYELDGIEKDGFVEAQIPNSIPSAKNYTYRLVTSSPKAISPWSSNQITIGEKPSAEIISSSTSVDWGKSIELKFRVTGIGPWNINLSDGTSISYNYGNVSYNNNPFTFTHTTKPDQTKSYSVSSYSSSCGLGSSGTNVMNVVVKPGIEVDSLQQGEICLGGIINATYKTKGDFSKTKISAFLSNRYNGKQTDVPAVFNDGKVTVTVPKTFFESNYSSNDVNFLLGIKYGDFGFSYSENTIRIKNPPKATFYDTSPINLNTKGVANLPVYLSGATPLNVIFDDSTNFLFNSGISGFYYPQGNNQILPISVIKTTNYKILSVSNSCGKTIIDDGKIVSVIVKNEAINDISIKGVLSQVCTGDKVKLNFVSLGTYKPENEFKVELFAYSTDPKPLIIGTGKTSPIEAIIPSNYTPNNYAYIRIISSNPTSTSLLQKISINSKPTASISAYNSNENFTGNQGTVVSGEPTSINASLLSGIYTGGTIYTFSDGTLKNESSSSFQKILISGSGNNTFFLKSVSNECGIGTVSSNSVRINLVPFKIKRPYEYRFDYCAGETMSYVYSITGKPDVGTTFNLQIASIKDSIFTDLVTKTSNNPLNFKFPTNLKAGAYFIRLVSNTTTPQSSDFEKFNILTPVSSTISTTTNSVDGGYSASLKYTIEGSLPVTITSIDENGNPYVSTFTYSGSNNNEYSFIPSKTNTYSIKLVENLCGYGTGVGSAKITVKPSIVIKDVNSYSVCVGKDLLVNYVTFGEYEANNKFQFSFVDIYNDKIKYDLGESISKSGIIKLRIPSDVSQGNYYLEVNSTQPSTTKSYFYSYFSVVNLPNITISGNTVINAGQSTYLGLINNASKLGNVEYGTFVLSDGTKGNFNLYKNNILVKPAKTTTYTLSSVENICGIGKVTGSATITVNPLSNKNITSETDYNPNFVLCPGRTYNLYFNFTGDFSTGNQFLGQISDKNGENFKNIITEGTKSPLKVTVPEDLTEGDNFRLRVVASDKDVSSAASLFPMSSSKLPTATFDSTTYYYSEGKSINIKVNLTGVQPWTIKFGSEELSAKTYYSTTSPAIIKLSPLNPISYKVFSISDSYCLGKVTGTGIVKLELITNSEVLQDVEVKIFPNPTYDKIRVQSEVFKNTSVRMTNGVGQLILEQIMNKSELEIDLSNNAEGQYFITIEKGDKRKTYKVHKF